LHIFAFVCTPLFFPVHEYSKNESTARNVHKTANYKLTLEDIAMLQERDHGSYLHLGMEEE